MTPFSPRFWLPTFAVLVFAGGRTDAADRPVDFVRDVLPIWQRSCFECHGAEKQEGNLRLDQREAALRGGDSGPAIIPGDADSSELIARITLTQQDDGVMPARGKTLSRQQVDLIRRWIDSGAGWPEQATAGRHWSYVPPEWPPLPAVRNRSWPRTPVDNFILERLDQEDLPPSPEADAATLARRVYLDLTGLPPTPDELSAFLADGRPAAWERLVDRLLASPQFGARWARPWLDYARYADSHGFQRDDFRDLWPYRDWVVDAFNADMAFDQFTTLQLAGDLIPGAGEAEKIASGFNRNAPTNVEAGSDPEETRVNQVFDRINTLGMVWLGSTLECCQCHNHKYDPFTMQDYYGLFAFFNNTEIEADRSNPKVPGSIRFLGPQMSLQDDEVERARQPLQAEIDQLAQQVARQEKSAAEYSPDWENEIRQRVAELPQEHPLDIADFDSLGGATHELLSDKSVLLSGEAPDRDTYTITVHTTLAGIRAFKLDALTDPSLPGQGPGRGDAERPNFVLNTFAVSLLKEGEGEPVAVPLVRATADFSQQRFNVEGAIDDDPKTAWAINPKFHQPHWAVFETAAAVGDGEPMTLQFRLEQNFGSSRTLGRIRLTAITGNYGGQSLPAELVESLRVPRESRSAQQQQAIAKFRLEQDPDYQALQRRKTQLQTKLAKLALPTTLVMRELDQSRSSHLFTRGDFRNPGDTVARSTPAILPPLRISEEGHDTSGPPTRLDLAKWLVRGDNPLVARVVVNRWWSELFGHGLVTTPEDFGLKGELPTHPQLLDWLALRYQQSGWSLKELLREIVLSSTYRQSAHVSEELLARDDRNLLYARGPRFRLPAESIRDTALAIAGLLSLNQGGPPIHPYQPDGIWIKVGGQRYDYVVSPGEQRYRRGIYVVWKRGAPYPSLVNFDANNRMACRVQRPRSNTPLQALTLLNDPVYVEAAQAFASRVLTESPETSVDGRIEYAFRVAVQRTPQPAERETLLQLYEAQLHASRQSPESAKEFTRTASPPDGVGDDEFVAWCAVTTALLNLDETITKG